MTLVAPRAPLRRAWRPRPPRPRRRRRRGALSEDSGMTSCASLMLALAAGRTSPRPAGRPRSATDCGGARRRRGRRSCPRRDPRGALERARRALDCDRRVRADGVRARPGARARSSRTPSRRRARGYARHRAILYEAVGTILARQGQRLPASRYLRRAFLLDPTRSAALALARALTDLGRGREALETVQRAIAALAALPPASRRGDRARGGRGGPAERAGGDRPRPAQGDARRRRDAARGAARAAAGRAGLERAACSGSRTHRSR